MIPDAILSAFVEAKGAREATRAIQGVQDQLQQATKAAELATAAVNRFGRVRGIAVLDVDAARARAQAAEATKQVEGFGRERASATLDADAARVRVATAQATREVEAFGRTRATAVLDTDTRKIAAMNNEVRRSTQNVGGLTDSFDGLRTSKGQTDRLIDRNVGTFGQLAARIRGAGDATVGVRGSLGPLSGGLGVVATAALFFGTSLLSIAGPAVAVAAALAPLVGLAAGVAGGLGAAAQGFGVFKLATMGVLDALKEQNKASQTVGTGALKQAGQEVSAGRAIRSAQEGVTAAKEATSRAALALSEAQRTERQAIAVLGPAYTEARMRLRDMRDSVIATNLSLRDAQFAAADARKALADLLGGPSPRALADAHLAVADAMRGERSAAGGLADATRALNELMAPPGILALADARDAVADATRGETRAQLDLARQLSATNAVLADPAASEADKADARLRLADAENAVGDAARASAHAQEALSKLESPATQDEIARARGRVQDAEAAVAAAKRDTLDAQDALAKVETPASSDEIARARLALAQAEHGLTDAVKDNTRAARDYRTATAAGLAQAPSVIAAREAFRSAALGTADAERSLADAQRAEAIAARSVSEAQADAARSSAVAAGAATNLNQKMNALPPAAQAFVRQLQAMKPRLDELRQTAAQGFFPGATEGLRAAMGSFSSVNKVVGETSTVLGDAARKSGELVGSPAFGRDIEIIGGRNAKVIGTLGEAFRHVISALRHVLVAAGPLTQWLADLANKWALNAAVAAKAGRENGKLADFFDRTRAVTVRLLSIIGHLTHGLFGIGKAGTDSGNSILLSIDRAAKRFDEWSNSVGGQTAIRDFFQRTKDIAAALVPAIANVAGAFGALGLRILPVAAVLRVLGPHADEAVVAFVAWKLAITAVNIVMKLFAAQAAIAAFATGGWTTAFWALNAAIAANPIGIAVIALAALVAGLVLAWHSSETFRDVVLGAWDAIKNGVGATIDWMIAAVSNAWAFIASATRGAWGAIVGFLTGAWTGLQATASSVFGAIGSFITSRWNDIRSATTSVWTAITGSLATAWSAITSAATAAWGLIRDAILSPIRAARDAFPAITGAISSGLGSAWAAITAGATTAWNTVRDAVLTPIRAVRDLIPDILDGIANRVTHGFDTIVAGAKDFAGNVKDAIVGGIKDGANAVVGLVNDIISVINVLPGVDIGKVKALRAGGTLGPADAAAASATAGATPFARGGAFGMTGGVVDRPIAIMGEDAPTFAEYVIPTNPAYRGRAQQLAIAAASAVGVPGFALGGILDAVKGGASGLWDIVSGGVGGLVGGLPGIGDLPDWIRGLGSWVIDRIKNWITDQVGGLLGGGGGGGGTPNLGGVMKAATDLAKEHFPYLYGGGHGNFAIQPVDCSGGVSYALHGGHMLSSPVTTDGLKVYGESGDGDLITIGVRGSTGRNAHTMMQIAGRFYESGSGHGWARTNGWSGNFPIHRHPKGFAQGGMMDAMLADIFDPADVGWGLARGGLLGSFQRGTDYVPQTGPYLLHRGESVSPAAAGLTGNDLVEAIRQGLGELDVRLVIDGEAIDSRVQIVVDRRDRAVSNGWAAGRLSP